MKIRAVFIYLVFLALPASAQAHEFWISPYAYQVAQGEQVTADLKNGQKFKGYDMSWFDSRIVRSEWAQGDTVTVLEGRAGDVPALKFIPGHEGLVRVVHQTTLHKVRYHEPEVFTDFVVEKDLKGTLERHKERGLDDTGFAEGYTRFAKSLIGVGSGRGQDRVAGLEIELVAQANPYTDPVTNGLPVLLLYQGKPRSDAQVEVFERKSAGTDANVFTLRTNDMGVAHVPVKPGHSYLIDSVVMREPSPELAQAQDIVWESLWASLTFARP